MKTIITISIALLIFTAMMSAPSVLGAKTSTTSKDSSGGGDSGSNDSSGDGGHDDKGTTDGRKDTSGGKDRPGGDVNFARPHFGDDVKTSHDGRDDDGGHCQAIGCHVPPPKKDGFRFHNHNDVKVVHKTVVIHDRNNSPQNLIITANANGQCIITQAQVLDGRNVLSELLNQCVSVTIVP